MRDAVFLLTMPVVLGIYGLALVLNLFGAASNETDFYRGRGEWYPILDGDQKATHQLAGLVMVLISGISIAAIVATGIVSFA
ncbi:MAG: hypothetical protein QOK05_106 [Chloroflexota bacterium]|jgi:hypothetical protein|nr:hypothetical protein [Chloroflexota bacterium]